MQGVRWGLHGSVLFVQHRRLSRLRSGEFRGQVNTMIAGHKISQQFKGSQSLFPFFLGPVLMLMCSLLVHLAMDSGQHGLCHWSDTSLSEPVSASLTIWAMLTHLLVHFVPRVHPRALASCNLVAGSPLFLPWTTLHKYWPLQTGNTPQVCCFGNTPTQLSSHHNLAHVKLAQIFMLDHISYFNISQSVSTWIQAVVVRVP